MEKSYLTIKQVRPAKSDLEKALYKFTGEQCELTPISEGDSSFAFAMVTKKKKSFIKVYNCASHFELVQSEVKGLNALRESGVRTPGILNHASNSVFSFINTEWIEEGGSVNSIDLANQLVALHKTTSDKFGYDSSNFIGTLAQSNQWNQNWADFWWTERIEPLWKQLKSSADAYLIRSMSHLEQNKHSLFPIEAPSLLHGDMWGGNVLAGENQEAYLIDCCVYFGHREMDLAMLMLFSADFRDVLEQYNNRYPLKQGWEERVYLFQLYPLLVHWKLFGEGYKRQLESAFKNAGYL